MLARTYIHSMHAYSFLEVLILLRRFLEQKIVRDGWMDVCVDVYVAVYPLYWAGREVVLWYFFLMEAGLGGGLV